MYAEGNLSFKDLLAAEAHNQVANWWKTPTNH